NPLSVFTSGSLIDAFNVFFLGVLATGLGFIWYYDGIKKMGAARAAAFINFVPLFGLSLGALFLGEKPHMTLLWGAILVITGVTLANINRFPFKKLTK
ncbi:MAG: DMT family transporter, partial [Halobacteriovoraceae bacterium]|nr:DMT family transporter [Halobacteriovoraceae bacterium]